MLAQLRCRVILACRSKEKTDRVVYLIQKGIIFIVISYHFLIIVLTIVYAKLRER